MKTEWGLAGMTGFAKRFRPPVMAYQYLNGAAGVAARRAGRAVSKLLAGWGIPERSVGSGFGDQADATDFRNIPAHDDFVLILHDDGGLTEEEFYHIATISAPILLLYYTARNDDAPGPTRWRMAEAALGMDSPATWSLRKAGFESAMDLRLPFERGGAGRQTEGFFSIVVPGDLTKWREVTTIMQAYARFRQSWKQPGRLYLMGRTLDAGIAKAVQDEARAHNLTKEIHITGSIGDEAREAIFKASDLCVFIGNETVLPDEVLRACLAGLPLIGPPVAAIRGVVGEAGLQDEILPVGAAQLADVLLHLAEAPAALAELGASQKKFREVVYSEAKAAKVLANALGRCGLALPVPLAEQESVPQLLKFIVAGHFEGSYSIAAVNRMLAAALEARRPGSAKVMPVAHHRRLDVLREIPQDEDGLQQALFARECPKAAPVVAISQHFPPWIPDIPNDLAVCLFTWEESLVPPAIVETINTGFAGVVAVSRFVAKTLVDSGVRRPVKIVGQAVDVGGFLGLANDRPGDAGFTVLHLSSCFPRKGVDTLLQAWALAFAAGENVRLVIKTFPNPHQNVADLLERLREAHPNLAPVELVDADLDATGVRRLFAQAAGVVLPARGEGFNMVAAEAMLAGLPLIVTGFGGHMDFAATCGVRLLDFRFASSRSHVAAEGALWAEPDVDDLVVALQEGFAAYRKGNAIGLAPDERAAIAARFDAVAWADKIARFAGELLCKQVQPLRRIAWVSSWGVRCGIAEYSRELLQHRKLGPTAPDILLLCDMRSAAAVGGDIDGAMVQPVWQLGSREIARQIAPQLMSYEPQLLVVQHQAGLVSWEDLVEMIDDRRGLPSRMLVVLHSTEAIASLHHKLRATVLFSLSLVSRVIVHTLRDLENLRVLGVFENVTVLPHGAGKIYKATEQKFEVLRCPVLGCYGFFLPHKGIATLIAAFAGILQVWPAARLRLVNAAFPSEVSSNEIRSCRALARRLGVEHAVEFHVRYLEQKDAQILLAGCDLVVMPYDETPESVSGAVRHALASGSPVAVSHSVIFDELGNAVHRVDAANAEALSRDIAGLLSDMAHCRSVLEPAAAWLARHDWSAATQRFFDMAEGLWQARDEIALKRLKLTPKSPLLENNVGWRNGRRLVFSGEAEGFGLYGPYIDLGSGHYEVIFNFDRACDPTGEARFEIFSQVSFLKLAELEKAFTGTGEYEIQLRLVLVQKVREVEFRIFCHQGFSAIFESVSIEWLGAG